MHVVRGAAVALGVGLLVDLVPELVQLFCEFGLRQPSWGGWAHVGTLAVIIWFVSRRWLSLTGWRSLLPAQLALGAFAGALAFGVVFAVRRQRLSG
jgi:hypothetical protein